MEVYREVLLKSKLISDHDLVDFLKKFAQQNSNWSLMGPESDEYSLHAGAESCVLFYEDGRYHPAFAVTKKVEGIYYLANIVPRDEEIPMSEYNSLARMFALDFRRFVAKNNISISVMLSNGRASLKNIITSKLVLELFERYLCLNPTSYHPNDIERLDLFICAVSRYSRKQLDIDELRRYLIEELNWSLEDAEWCYNRIRIGLDVLAVHKTF